MKCMLIKFNADWCDEFTVEGFVAVKMEDEEVAEFYKTINDFKTLDFEDSEIVLSCGSNQELRFYSPRNFLDHIVYSEIEPEQYETLVNLGLTYYGFTKFYDVLENPSDYIDCDDDDNDDDY